MTNSVKKKSKGMDFGQISLGSSEEKYQGTKGYTLTRDENYPIRCTVQYYRVTDTGTVTEKDVADIAKQLSQVEKKAEQSGSLVVGPKGERKTEMVNNTEPFLPKGPKGNGVFLWGSDAMVNF